MNIDELHRRNNPEKWERERSKKDLERREEADKKAEEFNRKNPNFNFGLSDNEGW